MSDSTRHEILGLLYLILFDSVETPWLKAVTMLIVLGHAAAALYYGIKEV